MSKGEKENRSKPESGALHKLEPGGELGPIEDRNEYEQQLSSLPVEQKGFAEESTRIADLCQYFFQQKIDIPPSIVDRLGNVSKLPVPDRIRAMKDINRELMEYVNDVGEDPGIRQ
ncbi:MAG TPA: hypothetical protein VNO32_61850 [Candidatus Acidoferrum sp.]|nr:hypothetical protein [Candidatus Acidoferrum sp.]